MEVGLNHTDSNAVLTVIEIESTLHKIFQLARENCEGLFEPEKATELTLNWILKCYDRYDNVYSIACTLRGDVCFLQNLYNYINANSHSNTCYSVVAQVR